MVLVILNGRVLLPGGDYEWNELSPFHTIRFSVPLLKGDVIQFADIARNKREAYRVTETSKSPVPVWERVF